MCLLSLKSKSSLTEETIKLPEDQWRQTVNGVWELKLRLYCLRSSRAPVHLTFETYLNDQVAHMVDSRPFHVAYSKRRDGMMSIDCME